MREDQAKVLSEGKLIVNQLCKVHNLSLEEGLKKKAVVGQIRGLKAILLELRLVASGCYMPSIFDKTIKFPVSDDKVQRFIDGNLEQLFAYKVCFQYFTLLFVFTLFLIFSKETC